jgi:hypothetical protein
MLLACLVKMYVPHRVKKQKFHPAQVKYRAVWGLLAEVYSVHNVPQNNAQEL